MTARNNNNDQSRPHHARHGARDGSVASFALLATDPMALDTASIAMLRRPGFVSRSGTGVLREFELAVTPPPAPARAPAESRQRNP